MPESTFSSSKRVALVCQHFYPEMISTGMHMTELAESLRERGWDIVVYCAQPTLDLEDNGERLPSEMWHEGIRIVRVPTMGGHSGLLSRGVFALTYFLSSLFALFRNAKDCDGLLVTTNPPFIGIVGRLVAKLFGKPYAFLVYDVYPDIAVELGVVEKNSVLRWGWERLTRFMLNGADAVVVIGRDMADIIKEKMHPRNWSNIQLIPNWSDEDGVQPTPKQENPFRKAHDLDGKLLVQYSGRMGTTHNLEPLVEAATALSELPIQFQLIGGGAKKEKLQQMVEQRQLENVQFLPYQPLEQLGEVLSAADLAVVCLESRFTGLSVPSKTYGVMAGGVPILGFLESESEIGRTVQENECGVVLEDPTGIQVAEVIRDFADHPERLEAMGTHGRRAFEENYTLSLAAKRYDTLLKQCFYGEDGV